MPRCARKSKKKTHDIARKDLYNKIKPCYTYLEQKPNLNGETTMDDFLMHEHSDEWNQQARQEEQWVEYQKWTRDMDLEAEGRDCPDCAISL